MTLTLVHALKYAFNKTLSYFWYLKHRILTRICSEAYKKSLKKLCSEIINFHSFQRQFLQLCFKYASEQILVKIQCLKYQKLFKILFKSIFQGMYYRADKTDTLTSIQHTVWVSDIPVNCHLCTEISKRRTILHTTALYIQKEWKNVTFPF